MSWRRIFRRARWDRERAAEMAAYLELETAANLDRGMTPAAARHAAQRKLGNTTLIREEIYRMNSIAFFESLRQDLQYALRVLRKSPGFALVAVLSLALGVGANTTAFSLVHALLLRQLPYPDPGRIVMIGQKPHFGASVNEYLFWKEHARAYSSVAAYGGGGDANLIYGPVRESVKILRVSADFFRTLGVTPQLGREFDGVETSANGGAAVIVTDAAWHKLLGGARDIVGRPLALGGRAFTVVGVLPPDFWFSEEADVFLPFRPSGVPVGDYGTNNYIVARVKPGFSVEHAAAEIPALSASYLRTIPSDWVDNHMDLGAIPLQQWLTGDLRTKVLLLFGATGLLLLIACTNLAGLLLARLEQRQKEISVRLALGSSRGRLLRQFLIENVVLCGAGSAAGLLAAAWSLRAILAILPFHLPASQPVRLDPPVLAFTLAVTVVTGLVFSLGPFLTSAGAGLHDTLKSSGRSLSPVRQRARSILVVGEVALSVTLLVSAALVIQSLYRLHREPLGFRTEGILTFWAPAQSQVYRNGTQLWAFENTMIERLGGLSGVHAVAAINALPLTSQNNYPCEPEGRPDESIGGMEIRIVTPGYFNAMGVPMVRGRAFNAGDSAESQPVILVNETVARRWWPKNNALGDRVLVAHFRGKDLSQGEEHPREVIGVVSDTKTVDLKKVPRPTVYISAAQAGDFSPGGMAWIVRADHPAAIAGTVRRAVLEIEPRQRVLRMQTMDEIVNATTADSRFDAWLFGSFAALALVLTAIGVYGLLSFAVARRTSEIGTRMALGASRGDVLRLVLRQGMALTGIGLVVGLAGAFALTRSMATLLYGVTVRDPLSFTVVAAVLVIVGTMASYLPARRATKVDPLVALRYE